MKTHKFARKRFYVDAVRVTEGNIHEVAEWCDGTIEDATDGMYIRVKVYRPFTERQTQAFVGDWVLFSGTGFKVYVPSAFDKTFEKVKTLTKEQADAAGIKVPHEPSRKPSPANPVLTKAKVHELALVSEENALPGHTVKLIGDRPLESGEVKVEENETIFEGTIGGHVMACHTKKENPDWACSCPKSKADVEADKLIAEVDRLRNS